MLDWTDRPRGVFGFKLGERVRLDWVAEGAHYPLAFTSHHTHPLTLVEGRSTVPIHPSLPSVNKVSNQTRLTPSSHPRINLLHTPYIFRSYLFHRPLIYHLSHPSSFFFFFFTEKIIRHPTLAHSQSEPKSQTSLNLDRLHRSRSPTEKHQHNSTHNVSLYESIRDRFLELGLWISAFCSSSSSFLFYLLFDLFVVLRGAPCSFSSFPFMFARTVLICPVRRPSVGICFRFSYTALPLPLVLLPSFLFLYLFPFLNIHHRHQPLGHFKFAFLLGDLWMVVSCYARRAFVLLLVLLLGSWLLALALHIPFVFLFFFISTSVRFRLNLFLASSLFKKK